MGTYARTIAASFAGNGNGDGYANRCGNGDGYANRHGNGTGTVGVTVAVTATVGVTVTFTVSSIDFWPSDGMRWARIQ